MEQPGQRNYVELVNLVQLLYQLERLTEQGICQRRPAGRDTVGQSELC